MLLETMTLAPSSTNDRVQQRQIDRSICKALTDGEFARQMFSNPTVVLEDVGCTLSQYRSLRSVRATTVNDFARQVHHIFWPIETMPSLLTRQELPLAAAR
jgi:hypothetical protein